MTFCHSIYVNKVTNLLAFIFEQPSYFYVSVKHRSTRAVQIYRMDHPDITVLDFVIKRGLKRDKLNTCIYFILSSEISAYQKQIKVHQ